MKKFLCLNLVVIMLFSLYGCFGSIDVEDVRGEVKEETDSESTQKNEEEPEFSLGKTTNNTYTNDFLGLSFTLPDEWVFYTDEQILELNNILGEFTDEEVAESIKNANIIYDMYAADETEGSNININLEKLNSLQIITLDIKEVLESQIDTIESTYQNMGCSDINVEYQKIEVDGKEFDGLKLTAKIQGIDFYSSLFSFRRGSYLANVAICSLQTDKTDTILDYFTVN